MNWLKLGTDVLGVLPGLGALKGFTALKGLKGLSKLKGFGKGFDGGTALRGVGDNFLNGVSVKLTNKTLAYGLKLGSKLKVPNLPAAMIPIEGRRITGIVKGIGFASALNRFLDGENGDRTGYVPPAGDQSPTPTPGLMPSPPAKEPELPVTTPPAPSPGPFHAALAA